MIYRVKILLIVVAFTACSSSKMINPSDDLYNVVIFGSEYGESKDTIVGINFLFNNITQIKKFNYEKFLITKSDSNSIQFESREISIFILKKLFNKESHNLDFVKEKGYVDYLERIDSLFFYGADGNIPKYQFAEIIVKNVGDKIPFLRDNYVDLFEPNINCKTDIEECSVNCYRINEKDYLIWMNNSDGAGSYSVLFIFKENRFYKRFIGGASSQR